MSLKKPIYKKKTFCNPMSMPECPRGIDATWELIMGYTGEEKQDYRSVSDPSVLYYDNKWYLYPSYGMSFVSEDFVTWKHVRSTPYNMKYSPSVIPYRGKFLMTSHSNGMYIGDTPTGPFEFMGNFITADGKEYVSSDGTNSQPLDSALFLDDDGKIYMYWFEMTTPDEKGVFVAMSVGVELDGENPRKFKTEPYIIHKFDEKNPWEHNGADNQDTKFGWIEGQWMLKHNGRYYMIYATPGTQYRSYCMAAYYSDEGPLCGFVCQKHNPVTEHRFGLVSGAGHGCIAHGPNNSLWAFYTVTNAAVHPFERRIGMDRVYVNSEGELYANVSDTPQFGFGDEEKPQNTDTGLKPLTFMHRQNVKSSSHEKGRETIYAFDYSTLTWWQPLENDPEPTLTVDVGTEYVCEAVRIMWRDVNMDYDKGIIPGAYGYVVEGREKVGEGEWRTLLDMSNNKEDYNIDYRSFPPAVCRELRLRILSCPKGIIPGVVSFTVFGNRA